ncbi:MAG TPA: citrate synthase [Bryobacteraceae bacterium]|nr:citrate synthase [Bryobacteraceae bacterium]
MPAAIGSGLEGVIAAESRLCFIDGEAGILSYQGYDIRTLGEKATFEEVIFLLWNGRLPKQSELDQLKAGLVAHREIPAPVEAFLKNAPKGAVPMAVLRTAVSMLALYDPLAQDMSPEANRTKALKLMAQTATIVSSFDRLRNASAAVPGDPKLGFAANFLYTLTGQRPDEVMERAFDVALVLHAEHELNASTFAARVTAATLSDIYSAITSAIGALKGPLHGGANEDVIKLLLTIQTPEEAIERVKSMLANKTKIPGLGHRVYHTLDPRAAFLKNMAKELGERTGHVKLYEISNAIQQYAKQAKNLNANVDFFSASTYYSLRIPVDLFTPIFAVSRMSGWTAHILEQYHNNRLIRPRAEYTGEEPGKAWVDIAHRG